MSETRTKTMRISDVTASGGSPTVSCHPRPAPAPTPSRLYFYLQMDGEENDLENDSGPQLQPCQTIRLRVSTSENEVGNQLGWVLRGDIELILHCEESCIQIAQPRMRIPHELLAKMECVFEITPAPDCPRGNAAFKVFVRDLCKGQSFPVTTFKRYIAGNVNRDLLESVNINIGTVPPEYVAILHIEEQRTSQQLRLMCGSPSGAPLSVELSKPTRKIGLSEFVEDKVQPSQIRGTISRESRHLNQELLAWLQRLYGQHGSKLCLFIADHTDTEIPWEMMQFDEGKHLGAMVAVSRWIPIPGFHGVRELSVAEQEFSGSVVAHVNEHDIKYTESERQALTLINAEFHNTADALRGRLQKPLQGVGAVYLACHGIFSYGQRYEIALGQHSPTNPSSQIFAVELEDLCQSEEPRPLFFVNACHSARLLVDEWGRCGLPEVALSQFANAYIGTLGPVGMEYAARIGQEMLQRAASQEGLNPAEELRRLRAEAVERVKQDPSNKNQCELIYAFMYVYYGNPMARLRLSGLPLTDQQEANK